MPETLSEKTIAELTKLGRMSVAVQVAKEGGIPFAVIPSDCKVQPLSDLLYNEHNATPERVKGTAKVLDADSFCAYYTLFNDPNSRVFADETSDRILAVLDYHAAGEGTPRWGQHRLDLTLRHSEEWKTWTGKNAARQTQTDFAEFIESNAPDIVSPDGATMLEVARDISAKTDGDFGSAIRMANGSVQFKYSEQVKGTFGAGNLEVPEKFIIAIPVHIGSDRVQLTARLRYRINSGKLTFWYDLHRADAVERLAFATVHAKISDTLKITIINGTPA